MSIEENKTDSVQVPIIRTSRDEHAALSSLIRRINWMKHNPTPEHPIQGRKRGQGRNRATKRGKREKMEKKPATKKKR